MELADGGGGGLGVCNDCSRGDGDGVAALEVVEGGAPAVGAQDPGNGLRNGLGKLGCWCVEE